MRGAGRSGWRRVLLAGGALFATAALSTACGSDSQPVASTGIAAPGVKPVPGFADRLDPAVAAVGDDVFVFGGQVPTEPGEYEERPIRFRTDGARIDPVSGEAEALPDAPFELPLANPKAVRVGDEVVVLGARCHATEPPIEADTSCEPMTYAAATFDLERGRWRAATFPPELRSVTEGFADAVGATPDGRAVFGLGGREDHGYWAYSPSDDRWTGLRGDVPAVSQACIVGGELVEYSIDTPVNGPAATPALGRLALASGERAPPVAVPDGERVPFNPGRLSCAASAVLVLDPATGAGGAQRFDLTMGRWSRVPAAPADLFGFDPLRTGRELVFLPSPGLPGRPAMALDPTRGSWRTIADPPPVTTGAVWNGSAIVGYAQPLPAGGTGPDGKVLRHRGGVFRFPVGRAAA